MASERSRFGRVFAQMLIICPKDIVVYGDCVATKITNKKLDKGSCESEFRTLNKCFKKVLRRQRGMG